MIHCMQHHHPEMIDLCAQPPGLGRRRRGGELRHPRQNAALAVSALKPLWPGVLPVAPEQLGPYMVQPLQLSQVPAQSGHRRMLAQLLRHGPPLRLHAQLGGAPASTQLCPRPLGRIGISDARCVIGHGWAAAAAKVQGKTGSSVHGSGAHHANPVGHRPANHSAARKACNYYQIGL
ncbi:hypothetical protein D3C71_1643930 [compost metagenome]